jgi:hypothetical protein
MANKGEQKNARGFCWGNLKEIKHLGQSGLDGRVLKKFNVQF